MSKPEYPSVFSTNKKYGSSSSSSLATEGKSSWFWKRRTTICHSHSKAKFFLSGSRMCFPDMLIRKSIAILNRGQRRLKWLILPWILCFSRRLSPSRGRFNACPLRLVLVILLTLESYASPDN
ncbi:hypothetical protein CDL15_Pgr006143 [Punica granatum]|uniref:Uncharacterized protein n=1 Tax=Punica granatum TaxID=22663 RepID=A0A218VV37_PUNGR|nr:hypothetical protein CDL15_Pgr006143 [Punica granatum]